MKINSLLRCACQLALLVLSVGIPGLHGDPAASASNIDSSNKARVLAGYGRLPLSFEPNHGQTDARVQFLSRGSGYGLFLTSTEAVLSLAAGPEAAPQVLRMKLAGANRRSQARGLEPLSSKSNYFIGKDPQKWRTEIPHYARVEFAEVYPGVSLIYYGQERQLEYDFVVAAGANPERIRLRIEGAHGIRIDREGDLVLETAGGELRQKRPRIYQVVDGARREVAGSYVLRGEREVGFKLEAYDRRRAVVIDPVLVYSTYLGGSGFDLGTSIAVDSAGNAYVTGSTSSANFPTASPFQPANGGSNAFVTKLNSAGSALVYSTYLGGSGSVGGGGIAVDLAGNAYVTGQTASTNFPTTPGAFDVTCGTDGICNGSLTVGGGSSDAFVTKLNAAGSALLYSTYLGGSDFDQGNSIAVDSGGNAYVAGWTGSTNFPTASPFQPAYGGGSDAFVAKLNAAGSALVYSTYLGGGALDQARGVVVGSAGNAYVTGNTVSTNFPTASPFQPSHGGGDYDAFVAKLSAAGSALVYSTYLGGSVDEFGNGIAVDSNGNAYVAGQTTSFNFPTASPFQPANGSVGGDDAFVTKVNAAGSALLYSTYLGGSGYDLAQGIAVDSAGNAYVTGVTSSPNFPTASPFQPTNGVYDAFVAKLNAAGSSLVYSSYLGGNATDLGTGIAVDSAGNAYVTGYTLSTNFPTASPFQPSHGGGTFDAFVAKISEPLKCDVDHDGDIGINDIKAILAARNAPASGPNDPRDFDGDGFITVNDVRKCVLKCTKPGCGP